ncbi:MAG: hypothetical protein E7574_05570 [Ruminococcaceae bacterium]|nr:hypothetical protein [Oscillospiraceae bacterium]
MIFKNEDQKNKNRSKIEETDGFWDIGNITPFKSVASKKDVIVDTDAVTVYGNDSDEEKNIKPSAVALPRISSELLLSYIPQNSFFRNVNILSWPSKYTFYERFRLDAVRYFNTIHSEVQPVKYFSYMPSYIQMSAKQRDWYFYWRSCVRKGIYLPTDSSYILLYVYEIINLPELIPAEKGIELLFGIWTNYRKSYTKLDKFLSEWVCDYCLINNIDLPFGDFVELYEGAKECSSLKQFYIKCEEDDIYPMLLLEKSVSYRWRNSKYIDESNRALFEKHIVGGFVYAVNKLAKADGRFNGKDGRTVTRRVIRDSFSGALCAYKVKRKIEVEYVDLSKENDISFIVTDIVRYSENRIRAYLGIRARLSVQNLTEQYKNIIDEYFDACLPCNYSKKRISKEDIYEIKELPVKEFSVSFEKAREIEKESWRITDRLVEDIEYEDAITDTSTQSTDKSIESEALDIAKEALIAVVNGDTKRFSDIAEESYMLPETLAECVNELCFELLGDVGIEEKDGVYTLIPDYEQEIRQWLNR